LFIITCIGKQCTWSLKPNTLLFETMRILLSVVEALSLQMVSVMF